MVFTTPSKSGNDKIQVKIYGSTNVMLRSLLLKKNQIQLPLPVKRYKNQVRK
jgi:hypothetical protein